VTRPARSAAAHPPVGVTGHDVANIELAESGSRRIAWAAREMPVLAAIRQRFAKDRPFRGIRVGACLHVTAETANLALTLRDGGASVALCASNPLSTNDEVAASLAANEDIAVYARKGEDRETYYSHIRAVLASAPEITMDDGADLVTELHTERRDLLAGVRGGTEETTTGVLRLRAMAAEKVLAYPIVAVNDAYTKHLFDNRFGTGQSAVDGILRATNVLLAGKTVVICGYGWVGKGIAGRMRGMGANVVVCEVHPLRALEAAMEGFRVLPIAEAARIGELFVTATGNVNVIGRDAIAGLKDGAILANAGHFNDEIDLRALAELAGERVTTMRPFVEEYALRDGRRIVVLADGRLVNLAAADGHPAAVMDMSFANQALSVEFLLKGSGTLRPEVHPVPREIDETVALLKLRAMGIAIDEMTAEQKAYTASWRSGT
jgi:adenosylhomocysteinase